MARVKYFDPNTGKWEYADSCFAVGGNDYGGNVAYDETQNLTDEQKAQARENIGAQPAGNYLTKVPEGYAKTEDVPTDAEIIQLIKDNAPESSGGGISVTGAKVGQTVKISAVDENGVPTAWEPTDFPGGESAADVLAKLNEYTGTNNERVGKVEGRVETLEKAGYQANVIEGIKLADAANALTLDNKIATIPAAEASQYGLVKLSSEIGVNTAGALEVKALNLSKITQDEEDWLILDGGTSTT